MREYYSAIKIISTKNFIGTWNYYGLMISEKIGCKIVFTLCVSAIKIYEYMRMQADIKQALAI